MKKMTRSIASDRQSRQKETEQKQMKKRSLDSLFGQMEEETKELNIVIKGDVQGSIEALKGMLEKN